MYTIQKNLNRLSNYQPTFFLDPKEQKELRSKLKKDEYKIFSPFEDSEKVIFYIDEEPEVILYEIKSKQELRHQDILGTMYSLNISPEMFGDIILYDNRYFIYVLKLFQNYFEMNFTKVRNSSVELVSLDISYLEDYKRDYEEIELIVSSERIDTVISSIIHSNRNVIKDKIKDKEILINHDLLKNNSYVLKSGDIFSIRKFGKYKYIGIIKSTKKDNYIVKCLKYL